MSDLSRLLGDVYGPEPAAPAPEESPTDETSTEAKAETEPEPEPEPATTLSGALPKWADESVLDEAFANWVPGPPDEAPGAERGMLTDLAAGTPAAAPTDGASPPAEPRATTWAEAVPVAPDFIFPAADDETAPAPGATTPRWQRGDDDLLPVRARGRSWLRR